jgi:FKBP-type peptidyl-prolyl cis-trans isomerase FklB
MRAIIKLLTAAGLGLVLLTACDQQSRGAPGPSYDLTPESNARFLADYAARKDVVKLPDGLMYRVLKAGTGPSPISGQDVVTVLYKGSLINGKVFDQTKSADEPAVFPAGNLIPGWVEALMKMKTGDRWELVVPAELGYGADGAGDAIPPNQTLVFELSLLKVEYAP